MDYQININGTIGPWDFSKSYISYLLSSYKDKEVAVRISSYGGSVDHAIDIRQQFIDNGRTTAYLFGMVASAATLISLGCRKVIASKYSMYLIHQVSSPVEEWGRYNADQMAELIDRLKKEKLQNEVMDNLIANMYADKTGMAIEDIVELMKQEKWMTAAEAKELGFIDEIIEEGEPIKVDNDMASRMNFLKLPAIPENTATPKSWLAQKLDAIVNLIDSKLADTSNTTISMTKEFNKINQILGVSEIASNETGINLTTDQAGKVDKKIDELENALSGKTEELQKANDEIAKLNNELAKLNKADGDSTKNKVEDDKTVDAKSIYNQIESYL